MSEQVLLLPGDGVGPEIMDSARRLLDELGGFTSQEGLIGGAAMDEYDGNPFPPETEELVRDTRLVLHGAVGGPKWKSTDPEAPRPEDGLLKLRQVMGTHANLRPAFPIPQLSDMSPLRPEHIKDAHIMIVRELLGGSYYGEKGREGDEAFDTRTYTARQVEAIAQTAFEEALKRSKITGEIPRVTNIDKSNVLETSRLWQERVTALHEFRYQDVDLEHLLVDNGAFQLLMDPRHYKVVLLENEHGDIVSDELGLMTGSLGILPSASIDGQGQGIFEPVHGSAPDIAGKNIANPIAMLLSVAMMLDERGRHSNADSIRWAINGTLKRHIVTPDLGGQATTDEVTDIVIRDVHNHAARQ